MGHPGGGTRMNKPDPDTLRALVAGPTRSSDIPSPGNPDAELIALCDVFSKTELRNWYRYAIADGELDDNSPTDRAMLARIIGTPATTPEGWRAKALAYTCCERNEFNSLDPDTTLLGSLVRDMVAAQRTAIVARCAMELGPLPADYGADGRWLGNTTAGF